MIPITKTPAIKAASLGAIAGMRTFYAPAVANHAYSRLPANGLDHSPLSFMQSITTSKIFKVLALGELVGDKLPDTPNRTALPGLIGRVASGALAGTTIYKAEKKNILLGGLIGGAAAIASTFGCYFLRKLVVRKTRFADPLIGALEDLLVISAGTALARSI